MASGMPTRPTPSLPSPAERSPWWAFAALTLLVLAVFGQMLWFDFIAFDDTVYVWKNPVVSKGLTLRGVGWAFTSIQNTHWHPLTWLSHMADCSLYGLHPGGHHATSVLIHLTTTLLLFVLWRRMTGETGPAFLVAALFGIHPLHVESVAWVAERKDVLSGLFWILTALAYVNAVRADGARKTGSPSSSAPPRGEGWLFRRPLAGTLVVALYALGLTAKPMLVTLPFTLLLLDFWPLGRLSLARTGDGRISIDPRRLGRLLLEKVPLFTLAAASCVITFVAMRSAGIVSTLAELSLSSRIANALVAWATYALQAVWPRGLSLYYARTPLAGWQVAASAAFVVTASTLAVWLVPRRPWIAMGWFWYFGTLVPVIGIVQVGEQARADRYSYIPLIGLFVLVAYEASQRVVANPRNRTILQAGSTAVVVVLAAVAALQASHWKNTESLFAHALESDPGNPVALFELGQEAMRRGDAAAAEQAFSKAQVFWPEEPSILVGRVSALRLLGRDAEAEAILTSMVSAQPDLSAPYYMLGEIYTARGDAAAAETAYRRVVELEPKEPLAHAALASLLARAGRADEAAAQAALVDPAGVEREDQRLALGRLLLDAGQKTKAVEILSSLDPSHFPAAPSLVALAEAWHTAGADDRALEALQRAARVGPDLSATHANLSLLLRARGDLAGAEREARAATALAPADARNWTGLARVLIAQGREAEAIAACDEGLRSNADAAALWFLRADLRMKAGDREKAFEDYRQGLTRDPRSAHGHFSLGLLLAERGQSAAAAAELETASRLAPERADYARAVASLREGLTRSAGTGK